MLHSNIGYHFGDGNMLYCVLHGRNGGHRKNGSTMVMVIRGVSPILYAFYASFVYLVDINLCIPYGYEVCDPVFFCIVSPYQRSHMLLLASRKSECIY